MLGLSVEQLESALARGLPLEDIAREQGCDGAQVRSAVKAACERFVVRVVGNGVPARELVEGLLDCEIGSRVAHAPPQSPVDYVESLHAAAAGALGVGVAELKAALALGRTIRQLAESEGVDLNEVRSALRRVHQDRIRQAMEEGELSAAQADVLLEHLTPSPWLASNGSPDPSSAEAESVARLLPIADRA